MVAVIRFKDGTKRKINKVGCVYYWQDGCREHEYPLIYVRRATVKNPELFFQISLVQSVEVREVYT